MDKTKPNVLIVDDEQDILDLLAITLNRMDINSITASDITSGKAAYSVNDLDLCITDMRLPDGNGLELIEWSQKNYPNVPIAMLTAHGNVESAVKALKLGAFDFVSKPVNLNWLRKLISTAIKVDSLDSAPNAAVPTMQDSRGKVLLGNSEAMEKLRVMIRKVARSQAPVHIHGESGTGKELVARLIHDTGPRADGPFIPVNCGAIPSELMESEFFGHKKGSFTGATSDKEGLIASADGGTLFLDEVGDLPLSMQVKLLRVIQEKAIRPIGANIEQPINVRFLSATHKDLLANVKEGSFREDLYYRINVIDINVPPLRERTGDIELMTNAVLERQSQELGLDIPTLSNEAKDALDNYHFPGNVRELENLIERAIALCEENTIQLSDLTLRASSPQENDEDETTTTHSNLEDYLAQQEREQIEAALTRNKFNKTKTAKELGLTLRQLRYKIQKLELE